MSVDLVKPIRFFLTTWRFWEKIDKEYLNSRKMETKPPSKTVLSLFCYTICPRTQLSIIGNGASSWRSTKFLKLAHNIESIWGLEDQ